MIIRLGVSISVSLPHHSVALIGMDIRDTKKNIKRQSLKIVLQAGLPITDNWLFFLITPRILKI